MLASDRYYWVDVLKAIGIVLVVLGHSSIPIWGKTYIYSFHMPLFFMISGFLGGKYKDSTLSQFANKQYWGCFVPYLLFSIGSYVIWAAKTLMHPGGQEVIPLWKPLVGILYGTSLGDGWMVHNGPLWFLPCLICVHFFAFFLKELRVQIVGAILSPLLGVILLKVLPVRLPWSVEIAFLAAPFYLFGRMYKKAKIDFSLSSRLVVAAGAFLALQLFGVVINGRVDMNSGALGNIFLFYLSAFSGCFFLYSLSRFFPATKVVHFLSQCSLSIFATHMMTFLCLASVLYILHIDRSDSFSQTYAGAIIYAIISIVVGCVVHWFADKHLPILIGRTALARKR